MQKGLMLQLEEVYLVEGLGPEPEGNPATLSHKNFVELVLIAVLPCILITSRDMTSARMICLCGFDWASKFGKDLAYVFKANGDTEIHAH